MKRIIPIIILLAALGGGYWWFNQPRAAALAPAGLVGSGSIEAEKIAITTEIGGRIIAMHVDEGDEVQAGQVLVKIDPANLLAQQTQLEAALATAKANLLAVSAPPRVETISAAEAQLALAKAMRDGAKTTWDTAQALVNAPHELQTRISQAQARVTEAQKSLEMTQVALKRAEVQAEAASRNQSNHAALVQNEVAQQQLQAAQVGVKMNEVALEGTQQQVALLIQLRDHPLQLISQVNAAKAAYQQAEAAVQVAKANLIAAQAGPTQEDIAIAQAQVAEAEAGLAAVQVQLDKLTLTAPRAGLINHRAVNVGELAAPGTALLELSDLETVDLTVYIPETQIGQVKVGQPAQVFVDAYPGETFEGRVTFIAHQAEFTPRNVQTQEERVNLVFGVKITLDNPDHRLKPGMPADAVLQEWKNGSEEEWNKGGGEGWKNGSREGWKHENEEESNKGGKLDSQPTNLPTFQPSSLPTPPALQPSNPPNLQPSNPSPTYAQILTWGLNVRSGPGVEHAVIAHLAQGDVVELIEIDPTTGWLHIKLPPKNLTQETGWISAAPAYVSLHQER
jgi:multidrug resistance efflux pump